MDLVSSMRKIGTRGTMGRASEREREEHQTIVVICDDIIFIHCHLWLESVRKYDTHRFSDNWRLLGASAECKLLVSFTAY